MKLITIETLPRMLLGSAEDIVLMLQVYNLWSSSAAYMAHAEAVLQAVGRGGLDMASASTFLAGLTQRGIVQIVEE